MHKQLNNAWIKLFTISWCVNSAPVVRLAIFNDESAQVLLALRSRTIRGIKNDLRGMHSDVVCPLGCGNNDTLPNMPNMLTCSVLQNNLHSENVSRQKVQYEDIFSPDIVKQKQVTELYMQLIEIRGPLHFKDSLYYQFLIFIIRVLWEINNNNNTGSDVDLLRN